MSKICMFGISGSGKTCYLYAMAQVMNNGVRYGDSTHISIISNDLSQQQALFDGYYTMAAESKWPLPSNNTTEYDFNVRVQHNQQYEEIIPSLILHDYAGGVWQSQTQEGAEQRESLLNDFSQSSAILFIVDSDTILRAMAANNPLEIDASHRSEYTDLPIAELLRAKQQISLVENLLRLYRQTSPSVPPVLLVITKGDLFVGENEVQNAYTNLRQTLPSIFAKGAEVESALTTVALGDNLVNENSRLSGSLDISVGHNIHIPMLFALYAYLDDMYDECSPTEQTLMNDLMSVIRRLFADKISLYKNGEPLFAL